MQIVDFVLPFVGIVFVILEFLLAVLVTDVAELLGADAGAAIVEVADSGAVPLGFGVLRTGARDLPSM